VITAGVSVIVTYTTDLHNVDDFDFSPDDSINLRASSLQTNSPRIRFASRERPRIDRTWWGAFFLHSHWEFAGRASSGPSRISARGGPPFRSIVNGPFFNHFIVTTRSNAYSAFASSTWNLNGFASRFRGVPVIREDKEANYGRTNSAPYTVWKHDCEIHHLILPRCATPANFLTET